MAEEYFSRLRRAEIGHNHHVAGAYLFRYAQESWWREDTVKRPPHVAHLANLHAPLFCPIRLPLIPIQSMSVKVNFGGEALLFPWCREKGREDSGIMAQTPLKANL
jgi:hypothetical protein